MNTIMVSASIFAAGTAIGILATTLYWHSVVHRANKERSIAIQALLAIRCTTTIDTTRACIEHERTAETALQSIRCRL